MAKLPDYAAWLKDVTKHEDQGAFRCEDVACWACAHLVEVRGYRSKDGNYHLIEGRLCCKTPFVVYLVRDRLVPEFAYIGMAEHGVLYRFETGHVRKILRIMKGDKYDCIDKKGKKVAFLKVQQYFAQVSLVEKLTGEISDRFTMTHPHSPM